MDVMPHDSGPLHREGLRARRRVEAKVAPTLGRAESTDALLQLAAAGLAARRNAFAHDPPNMMAISVRHSLSSGVSAGPVT